MDEPLYFKNQIGRDTMENMLLGTGIFMLSMMAATLVFSRLLSRPHGKEERKK